MEDACKPSARSQFFHSSAIHFTFAKCLLYFSAESLLSNAWRFTSSRGYVHKFLRLLPTLSRYLLPGHSSWTFEVSPAPLTYPKLKDFCDVIRYQHQKALPFCCVNRLEIRAYTQQTLITWCLPHRVLAWHCAQARMARAETTYLVAQSPTLAPGPAFGCQPILHLPNPRRSRAWR